MMNTSSFLMNHRFVFNHCEGLALTCQDKDTLSPFVVSKNYGSCFLEYLQGFVRQATAQRVLEMIYDCTQLVDWEEALWWTRPMFPLCLAVVV
jgi:hypothetical protein